LRALSGLADAARGAMTPADASAIAARIVAAFAPFAREEDGGADVDDDVDDDDDVDAPGFDAWEASVDAVASLADAADEGATPGMDDDGVDAAAKASAEKTDADAKATIAAAACEHVLAYWRAAAALEPPDADDADAAADAAADDDDGATTPPAHAAMAPLLRFCVETATSNAGGGASSECADIVWKTVEYWALHLPAWYEKGEEEGLVDDDVLDVFADVVVAAPRARVAAIANPGATVAASTIEDSDDAARVLAGCRALAAAARAASASIASSTNVAAAATNAAEAAVTKRAARAALHLLVAVGVPAKMATADPVGYARAYLETAATAAWSLKDPECVDGRDACAAAHVDALTAALDAMTDARRADAPDKKRLGMALEEAMAGVAHLVAADDADGGEEDGDDDDDDDDDDGSDSDSDSDDAGGVANETEEEFLERYAAIARDMASGGDGGGDGDDDDEGVDEDDDAFDDAFEKSANPRATPAADAFCAWYARWVEGVGVRDDKMRVASLVDAGVLKKFQKAAAAVARRQADRDGEDGGSE